MNKPMAHRTTLGKALSINQDEKIYGVFAEIGAGQEVARWFFQAGKASQTIAKTMSAYDMVYSDVIYGKEKSGRYVCKSRLVKMLDREYSQIEQRLGEIRGKKSQFFVFADTVATTTEPKKNSHGWLGLRFQDKPLSPTSQVVLHVRLLDPYRLQQQEVLSTLGVNLIYSSFYFRNDIATFLNHLTDDIKEGRLAIDYMEVSGPAFKDFDNRMLNLELVYRRHASAAFFFGNKEVDYCGDSLFNKPILVQRGSFRPVTLLNLEIMKAGEADFALDNKIKASDLMSLFEITLREIMDHSHSKITKEEFLHRIDLINELGFPVLLTHFNLFFELKNFLRMFSKNKIAMLVGAGLLEKIFDEQFYSHLDGGLLEGMGKLLDKETKMYVFPYKSQSICQTAKSFLPHKGIAKIYEHFLVNGKIKDLTDCDQIPDSYSANEIRAMIEQGDRTWESQVAKSVKEAIKKKKLFGLKG